MKPTSHIPDDPAAQAREWVLRLASGQASGDELQAFNRWLQQGPAWQQAFERERALWQAMGQVEREVRAMATGDAPQAVPVAATPRQPRRRRPRRPLRWGAAVAAVLAVVLIAPGQAWRWRADHRAGNAVERVALADGSQVMLDAGAAIRLAYDDHRRGVELLRGRAWFQVAHGDARPFEVAAGQGLTRDIGTAFEVDLQPGQVQATVSEGEVEIRAGRERLRLRAGQAAGYRQDGQILPQATVLPAAVAAWREGDVVIQQQPAATAIAQIGRYYPGRVLVLGDLGAAPVSGIFRSEQAEAGIRSVAAMAHARVVRLPGGYLLVRPGPRM